jgi:glycosyltransferase involved in cell wall biosynthesis
MVVEQNDRPVKALVVTTSFPRRPDDVAGLFIADAVEQLRRRGVDVDVVSPARFRHFGLAYGAGIVGNLRAAPWRALLLPFFLFAFARAVRKSARGADVVHAHWLPSAVVALVARKPVVAQVWGTDVELARRVPWLARLVLRRLRVVAPSNALADAVRALGARDVRVIPAGVELPPEDGDEDEPPTVLFAGRLSPEKGIRELMAAANGMPLVVAGDGPLRDEVPGALGFVPHGELERLYAASAVVACPSYREGFGVVCSEAMAHGKPVVASAVGGLLDLVVDGETGILVPPGDVGALRAALETLLADRDLRLRLGAAGRARIRDVFSWDAVTESTLAAYRDALGERA